MTTESFDAYSESYDELIDDAIGFMGAKHDYYTKAKVESLLRQLKRRYGAVEKLAVLDVGCGVGKTDALLVPNVHDISGVDISSASIERAKRANPSVQYSVYDGRKLPYSEDRFDAAFMICVLHHVDVPERAALVKEVLRVVKPGGSVFVFEHNPLHPLTRLVVSRCVFDRGVSLLSRRQAVRLFQQNGLQCIDSQYIIYLPFAIPGVRMPDCMKRVLPFGTQFMVSGVK